MSKLLNKASFLLLALFVLAAGGCSLKELNDDAATTIANDVQIVFDWSKVPEMQATTMGLYLYSEEHGMMDFWFNNPFGGHIRCYGGRHTAVCHSNDDPYLHRVRNHESHNEIEIFTDDAATLVGQNISTRGIPRAKNTENEPLRYAPSMIYGTQNSDLRLNVSFLPQTVTFYPEELVCHYSVEFVDVENLQSTEVCIDATISSMAGGVFPGRMTATSERVSHLFTLTADDKLNSLKGNFLTFGLPEGEKMPHMICLYIALKNRTGNFYTFDVSDQVNNAPDPRHVEIKIHGLKLPEIPDVPHPPMDGGLSVDIDSWEEYHFTLTV